MNVGDEVLRALGLASSDEQVAVAWGAVATGHAADCGIEAEIIGSSWRLTGAVDTVLWNEGVDQLLVVARSKPIAGRERGVRVYRIPTTTTGCTISPRHLLASDARSVQLDGVEVSDGDAVGPLRDASDALTGALDRLRVAAVDEMLAAADAARASTIERVMTREQFGAPLSDLQAVRHRLADMATSIAVVRGLADDARAAAEHGPCAIEAAIAKLIASDRLPDVTASAHQLHGGEGYYADHELHGQHKLVCTLAALLGNGSHQRVRLAGLLAE
jgi:alkylation response protein AidB-like acyl-CoA dehydrogenase